MKAINSQIEAYLKEPDIKYHAKELLEMIMDKINPILRRGFRYWMCFCALIRNLFKAC